MPIDIEKIASDLKADEGFRDKIYTCSAGANTIGYGFNLDANPFPESIASKLLDHGIGETMRDCSRHDWYYELNDNRRQVIINMAFNLGITRLCGFKNMIKAIYAHDWDEAANQMQDSNWYNQVGYRAVRLVAEMRAG